MTAETIGKRLEQVFGEGERAGQREVVLAIWGGAIGERERERERKTEAEAEAEAEAEGGLGGYWSSRGKAGVHWGPHIWPP